MFISFIIETRISVTESWFLPLKGAEFAPLWPTQSLPLPLHLFQLFFATTTTATATAPFLIFLADYFFSVLVLVERLLLLVEVENWGKAAGGSSPPLIGLIGKIFNEM